MGLVGLEPTIYWLKARCISHYATNPIINDFYLIVQVLGEVSLDHSVRIPRFDLWGSFCGHLRNCHKQQKRGGTFGFPPLLVFMVEYIIRP